MHRGRLFPRQARLKDGIVYRGGCVLGSWKEGVVMVKLALMPLQKGLDRCIQDLFSWITRDLVGLVIACTRPTWMNMCIMLHVRGMVVEQKLYLDTIRMHFDGVRSTREYFSPEHFTYTSYPEREELKLGHARK